MTTPPPAEIGMHLDAVDTPALLIDLDAFERNLKRMADALAGGKVRLRPHSKTHKSAIIGRKQMALGAVGLCCQKVGEAELMVAGGIDDVLVSNEVVGAQKLKRLAALAKQARVAVCADDAGNIADLDAAAAEFGMTLKVLVEINVGADRCGVEPGEPAVKLAQAIDRAPNLTFGGLQAYEGAAQHVRDHGERRAAIGRAIDKTRLTVELLAKSGLACEIVGGAGTGSFRFERDSGVYNELQAGSYVFMDADYARNLDESGTNRHEFEHSLFVLATVMSSASATRAVVDAGHKALSIDSGLPWVAGHDEIAYVRAADEHGKLEVKGGQLKLGTRLKLIPGHCDPTVNLHDWYVGYRGERVEALWRVDARGALR